MNDCKLNSELQPSLYHIIWFPELWQPSLCPLLFSQEFNKLIRTRFHIAGSSWVQLSTCFHYPNRFNWFGIKLSHLWFKNFLKWFSYTAKIESPCSTMNLMNVTHSWVQSFSSVSCCQQSLKILKVAKLVESNLEKTLKGKLGGGTQLYLTFTEKIYCILENNTFLKKY